jgi:hypothetical protein
MSVLPPGGKGTIMVTGFSGQAAWTAEAAATAKAAAIKDFLIDIS